MNFKNKFTKKLITSGIAITLATPIFFVISCSNNNSKDTQIELDAISYLKHGQIKVSINTNDKYIKLNDIKNYKFKYEVGVNEPINIAEQDEYENIKKAISKNKIQLVSYYIPKIGDDINVSLVFKINNNSELIPIQIKNIYLNNNKITENEIQTLTEDEIVQVIKDNLTENYSFQSDLIYKINSIVRNEFKNYLLINQITGEELKNVNIEQWWEDKKISEILIKELKNWFYNSFTFFNESYGNVNLQIDNNVLFDQDKKTIKFKLMISTSNTNNSYQIDEITTWIANLF